MKTIYKVLRFLLALALFLVIAFYSLRYLNDRKYQELLEQPSSFASNPSDLSLYDQEVPGIAIEVVNHKSMQGFHFTPSVKKHKTVVLCYGGSEGSPNYQAALALAKAGYESYALFMFGAENQPPTLERVPLEGFQDVLDYLPPQQEVSILAASRGTEYALHLSRLYPAVKSLILFAPSSYNFPSFNSSTESFISSWSYQGKDLPAIDLKNTSLLSYASLVTHFALHAPVSFYSIYQNAILNDKDRDSKLISFAPQVNLLLIAGEDDQLWPSAQMLEKLVAQRKEQLQQTIVRSEITQVIKQPLLRVKTYPQAGHIFSLGPVFNSPFGLLANGGSAEANQAAFKDSWQAVFSFLAEIEAEDVKLEEHLVQPVAE